MIDTAGYREYTISGIVLSKIISIVLLKFKLLFFSQRKCVIYLLCNILPLARKKICNHIIFVVNVYLTGKNKLIFNNNMVNNIWQQI